MKIFNVSQIREWEKATMISESITSLQLMERAAHACVSWIRTNYTDRSQPFICFCGRGNNGGDGLVIARLLARDGYNIQVYVLSGQKYGSPEFEANLNITSAALTVYYVSNKEELPVITPSHIIIDALFGIGMTRPLEDFPAMVIDYINATDADIISIDVPSGLIPDTSSKGNTIINASHTLSFQQYKLGLLLPENGKYVGTIHLININLTDSYYNTSSTVYNIIDSSVINAIYRKRDANSHKGTFGHALIIAGSYGMMGAAVLATKAAIRSGAGKVTTLVPEEGYNIMQISAPEAMCLVSGKYHIKKPPPTNTYNSIGIGPGLGRNESNKDLLESLFDSYSKPCVIDADALNELADTPALLQLIPPNSIITPHPKEFEKLFGPSGDDFARVNLAMQKAISLKIYIILKGHHTLIASPEGDAYFNTTGNPGMATGGSGDVLTGIITGLLAQSYTPQEAAVLGVYLHGSAGDFASSVHSEEAMTAQDIIDNLGKAFLKISSFKIHE